jgi:para-nitrobenzyl esterase
MLLEALMSRSNSSLSKQMNHALAASLVMTAFLSADCRCGHGQATGNTLNDPIRTEDGYVSGTVIGSVGNEVRIYRGIPYGTPPVGNLRWKPPLPARPWSGVRKSTEFGPIAPQYFGSARPNVRETQMSEDCLTLNILTATKTVDAKLPVMVWLHPGGLDSGNANEAAYNSGALVQHGVVLVTVNHRLGALGLLAYPGLPEESPHNAAGNYGMLDLVAALEWVRHNISMFGGDPTRVTIFGSSGGAQKVIWLLASPLAKGLFQRAIIESGMNGDLDANNTRVDTEAQAYVIGERFASRIGAKNLEELRSKSWPEVVKAMPAPPNGPEAIPAKDDRMHLTIDAWSLTDHPINIFDESLQNDVPVLIGGDTSEKSVFAGYTTDWLPALAKQRNNVYVYRFVHVPRNWKKAGVAAPPGFEVRYHFDALTKDWPLPTGSAPAPEYDAEDQAVAEIAMKIWVNFAASGDPSVNGLIEWPAFRAKPGEDKYVTIDLNPAVQSGFLETFKPGGQ